MKKVMGRFVNCFDAVPQIFTTSSLVMVLLTIVVRISYTSGKWESLDFGITKSLSPYRVYEKPPGPMPKVQPWNYSFSEVNKTFAPQLDLSVIQDFNRSEFEQMILLAVPMDLRDDLRPFLKMALENSQRYQIDPFWLLAIMWTESHFNPKAVSPVRAIGLMQVMPGTSHYLLQKMRRPMSPKLAYHLAAEPSMNIKMGAFYLRMLLKKFNGNHKLATVAYNMGPYRVKQRLRKNLPVGVHNHYLNKVTNNYRRLTQYADKYF
jgi:soluble lytic murein transglycosylase-like protein